MAVHKVKGRCELDLGETGASNGISINAIVHVPRGCKGFLLFTQLIDLCTSGRQAKGTDERKKTGVYWLDKQKPAYGK